ncbi:MAG: FtsX-like permease family protein [Acidobacteria bacterium]|nr:FtsX-like permease family protein [Acidobacteriota bacterium]
MDSLKSDIGYAARRISADPGFVTVAVLSLAFGIGVNSIVFTMVNAFLFKPLPVRDIGEVTEVFSALDDGSFGPSSYPDYLDFREAVTAFDGLAANMPMLYSWNRETHSETVYGELVSGNYFEVLGIEPAHGRWFLPDENRTPGTHPVAVLGHSFWERNFGGDPAIVGETIRLSNAHFTIVGIAPATFDGTIPVLSTDLWAPLMAESIVNIFDARVIEDRESRSLRLYGRLADGIGVDQARTQLETVAARLSEQYPSANRLRGIGIKPLGETRINPGLDGMITPVAGLLMGIVGMVLLVACANLANMLLARAATRRREIGVRMALGASRWRLIRQLLTESILLSLGGGAVALLVTYWVSRAITSFQPPLPIKIVLDVSPDLRVMSFTLAAAVVTGIGVGLAPAWRSSRPDLVGVLKGDAARERRLGRFSVRNFLVATQVAVSLVLLITAALFARSLGNAQSTELGFDETNIAFVSTTLSGAGYEREEARRLLRELTEHVGELPGVVDATYTSRLPMTSSPFSMDFLIEGHEPRGGSETVSVSSNAVGPRYFEILDIPLLAGRGFTATDDSGAPLVAVVNASFVDTYWPGENPIGKRLKLTDSESWIEVVGVSADFKMWSVGDRPAPMVHSSLMQRTPFFETIMVRTSRAPGPMVERMRTEISALNPEISFIDARTMDENLAVVLFPARMGAALLAVFGALALGLAAAGLYGVINYSVAKRSHEIGVRIALGADSRHVRAMVVRQGMGVVLVGVMIGLAGALALSAVLSSLLYEVGATDPVAFLGAIATLLLVALIANYLPARRGARVDPVQALRTR